MGRKQIHFVSYCLMIWLIISLTLGVTGCSSKTTTIPILTSITITPDHPSNLMEGYTLQITATGTFSDGSTKDITTQVNWTTSDRTTANFSSFQHANGVVTGMGVGNATITASMSGITSQPINLTVVPFSSNTTSP